MLISIIAFWSPKHAIVYTSMFLLLDSIHNFINTANDHFSRQQRRSDRVCCRSLVACSKRPLHNRLPASCFCASTLHGVGDVRLVGGTLRKGAIDRSSNYQRLRISAMIISMTTLWHVRTRQPRSSYLTSFGFVCLRFHCSHVVSALFFKYMSLLYSQLSSFVGTSLNVEHLK